MFKVELLGQFRVSNDDEIVTMPSRPAQSLLAYLVLNRGKYIRREKVAGVFWPDTGEANARAQLRHTLWRIRTTLSGYGLDTHLMFPEDNLHLQYCPPLESWLDVDEIVRPDSTTVSIETLKGQLTRYAEFLPGFNSVWDEWTTEWRELIQCKYLVKSLNLIDRLIKSNRWTEALDWSTGLLYETESLSAFSAMDTETMESIEQKITWLLHTLMESWLSAGRATLQASSIYSPSMGVEIFPRESVTISIPSPTLERVQVLQAG